MADTKITALTAITTVDPAVDVLPIVDVSDTTMAASGTTKKITSNQILGAGGTATLASATITGDLTVDTNTLKVDSANNRVGIGTASPAHPLDLDSTLGTVLNINSTNANGPGLRFSRSGTVNGYVGSAKYTVGGALADFSIDVAGANNLIFGVNDVEAMRLNSTGLGVGGSPNDKLEVVGSGSAGIRVSRAGVLSQYTTLSAGATGPSLDASSAIGALSFGVAGSTKMTLDSSGNVGIGVTPSAWNSSAKALQISSYAAFASWNNATGSVNNAYLDSGSAWRYLNTAAASIYYHISGAHTWQTAPSGTAGNVATFTTAMTLDASGNLYVGSASSYLASRLNLQVTTAQPDAIYIRNSNAALSTYWRLGNVDSNNRFNIYNQSSVGVYLTDGATSWTGTSDERLKDIIEPISNAVAKVGSLRSVIGKFKTDSEGTRRSFLIAQDVQSVLPEAVDASNADELGLRYTEVIPLLVAAIKELTARVQTLETR